MAATLGQRPRGREQPGSLPTSRTRLHLSLLGSSQFWDLLAHQELFLSSSLISWSPEAGGPTGRALHFVLAGSAWPRASLRGDPMEATKASSQRTSARLPGVPTDSIPSGGRVREDKLVGKPTTRQAAVSGEPLSALRASV